MKYEYLVIAFLAIAVMSFFFNRLELKKEIKRLEHRIHVEERHYNEAMTQIHSMERTITELRAPKSVATQAKEAIKTAVASKQKETKSSVSRSVTESKRRGETSPTTSNPTSHSHFYDSSPSCSGGGGVMVDHVEVVVQVVAEDVINLIEGFTDLSLKSD